MFATIIIFIIILGILVFVHEFGHFIVAKKSGMKVEEFGFGFPPRAFGIQKINGKYKIIWGHKPPLDNEKTVYSINWIPLGGFVKILGEDNEQEKDPRSFINRPFWPRFLTLVAGVIMNILLAWVLISSLYIVGLNVGIDNTSELPKNAVYTTPQIGIADLVQGMPAQNAGLRMEDVIVSVDGKKFDQLDSLVNYIHQNQGKQFDFVIERGKQDLDFKVNSLKNSTPDKGSIGVEFIKFTKVKYPWYEAFYEGGKTVGIQIYAIYDGLYQLVTSQIGWSAIGGPVKIAQLTGQVARLGFASLVQFTAFLSLNLALLNIIPFPALDGGRVLFLIIEKIRGKRNNQKVEQWFNTVGFMALLLLMLVVTVKDISSFSAVSNFFGKITGK